MNVRENIQMGGRGPGKSFLNQCPLTLVRLVAYILNEEGVLFTDHTTGLDPKLHFTYEDIQTIEWATRQVKAVEDEQAAE